MADKNVQPNLVDWTFRYGNGGQSQTSGQLRRADEKRAAQ